MAEATLKDVLDAREERARRQKELLMQYQRPLVCFTLNIAGPYKTDHCADYAYRIGRKKLFAGLKSMHYEVLFQAEYKTAAGYELMAVVDADAVSLKHLCVTLEESEQIGRLFDMDVLCTTGRQVSRLEVGGTERGCLVCGQTGKGCSSRRIHPLEDVRASTLQIIWEHRLKTNAQSIAGRAVQSLLDEVSATPKPGLVDRRNSGSHQDMDIFTFHASIAALWPYFYQCFLSGAELAERPVSSAFLALKKLGLEAERRMMEATLGINTHKGAIYTLGIMCAAAGRMVATQSMESAFSVEEWLQTCAVLAKCHMHAEDCPTKTNGDRARKKYGIGGVKQELADGLPSVSQIGLPAFWLAMEQGLNQNDRCVLILLHLMAHVHDTNMIARGGLETAEQIRLQVQNLLISNGGRLPKREKLEELDEQLILQNLSPGGCADLLAATLLAAQWNKI